VHPPGPGECENRARPAPSTWRTTGAALLTGLRGDSLVLRVSFFQLEHVRKARAAGTLHLAIAHEDILVLRNPI
jgi:hypothetical protein